MHCIHGRTAWRCTVFVVYISLFVLSPDAGALNTEQWLAQYRGGWRSQEASFDN